MCQWMSWFVYVKNWIAHQMILLQYYEKKVMLMKLINSKNILDCDEIEEVHTQENNEFVDLITNVMHYLKKLT